MWKQIMDLLTFNKLIILGAGVLAILLVFSMYTRTVRLEHGAYFLGLALAQEGQMEKESAGPLLLRTSKERNWRMFLLDENSRILLDSARDSYAGWVESKTLAPGEEGLQEGDSGISRKRVTSIAKAAIEGGQSVRPLGLTSWRAASPISKVHGKHGALVIVDRRAPELALLLAIFLGLAGWGGWTFWQRWQAERDA